MKKSEKRKPRTSNTYSRKLEKIKKWYSEREKYRKEHKELVEELQKKKDLSIKEQKIINKIYNELKPLDWYVKQLKNTGQDKSTKSSTISKSNHKLGGWW